MYGDEYIKIYHKQNTANDDVVKIAFSWSRFVIISVYSGPFALLLLYIICGFPSPDHWYSPLFLMQA